nr:bifunctional nicotinamidase/pyrazinamidase [Dactylosporangium thailandense]
MTSTTERFGADAAFIVVDVQNDFVSGSMSVPGAEAIIDPINAVAEIAEHVVVVTDWHPANHVSFASTHGVQPLDVITVPYGEQRVWPDHCVQGTEGAELDPRLRLTKAELVFRKGYRAGVDSYGAFFENDQSTRTGLADYLRGRGIHRLYLAGLARYGCVAQTALGAAREGLNVAIIDEAAAGGDPSVRTALDQAGVRWVSINNLTGKLRP